MHGLLEQVSKVIPETLSPEIQKEYKLISKKDALLNIHFPKSDVLLAQAIRRLKFEEFFFIQLGLLKMKQHRKKLIYPTHFRISETILIRFIKSNCPLN